MSGGVVLIILAPVFSLVAGLLVSIATDLRAIRRALERPQ